MVAEHLERMKETTARERESRLKERRRMAEELRECVTAHEEAARERRALQEVAEGEILRLQEQPGAARAQLALSASGAGDSPPREGTKEPERYLLTPCRTPRATDEGPSAPVAGGGRGRWVCRDRIRPPA